MADIDCDVAVIGAGNAALCAALAARESGASVVVFERAPEAEMGGNTRFTAGAIRCVYDGLDDLRAYMPDLSEEEIAISDFGTYTAEQYFDDMFRVTQYRCDADLVEVMVRQSRETMLWMRDQGVRFVPIYGRQAYKIDGRFTFYGGLTVESAGGGPGLIEALMGAVERAGIEVVYGAAVKSLVYDDVNVVGVNVKQGASMRRVNAKSVILACGGFEANPEWRTRYLGPGWEIAKVRGTRFNTGDGIRMALDIGAAPYGNWSGCHAVGWDRNAPEFGDLAVGDGFQKHSYTLGILVNADGKRFVDEGADFRNYTYAKYGSVILAQPAQFAWQVFDSKVIPLLRDEYRIREVTKVQADTIEGLAGKMEGVDAEAFLATVAEYNATVLTDVPFNPNIKDGRGTPGLAIPKTNWANTIDEAPFEASGVTCGITFTFGGLRVNADAQVLDTDLEPIPGLYAAGELVGGLFYFNYPGGSGLMSGSVFGRIAGRSSAAA
ncbi:MAG: FAD-dependent tricarballylate dehydrogenase TcuA [Rhodospirillales bacterium]|nr:FAD-dependent tricarballylate dehydrogenase TcuA [Rhodospirillales bacterium]